MAFPPPDFPGLLARLTRELRAQGVDFMLIGGQAVLLHGRPRLTEDIDVTVAAGPGELARMLEVCDAAEIEPLPEDIETFVAETFVLPAADPVSGIRVDLIFSTTEYERQAIDRAVTVEIEGVEVPFATPEDLVLHKLFAARARDIEDAESVVRRRGPEMDWDYLEVWADRFAEVPGREEMPAALSRLRRRGTGEV